MESTQREFISVLLERIVADGLISQSTYSKAEDLVHSVMDFPELVRYPVCLTEEGCQHECTQDP